MYSSLGSHLKLNFVELLGLEHQWASQTLLLDCTWISSGASVMSAFTGNVLGVSAMIPEMDFLGVELSEIEIVVKSLEDFVCFSDTVESLFSLISSYELLLKPDFKGKSVLLVAFLEELLFFLGSNVSEMLEKSV